MIRRRYYTLFALFVLVGFQTSAGKAAVLINNGLAPPSVTNVLNDDAYLIANEDELVIRDQGCPPAWPSGSIDAACPAPGPATDYEIASGGLIGSGPPGALENASIRVLDSSHLEMTGGQVVGVVVAEGLATLEVSGGDVGGVHCSSTQNATAEVSGGTVDGVVAFGGCSIDITGGTISSTLYSDYLGPAPIRISGGTITGLLFGTGFTVAGSNFEWDGVPIPYGVYSGSSVTLTGDLLLGGSVDASVEGSVTLVEDLTPPPSVPGLAGGALLFLSVAVMHTGVRTFMNNPG